MWKTLTFEEKEELVQILLDCGLDDATQRKSVLARVSDEITQRIIEGNTPLIIVSSIVAKCLEFGDGIEQLVYAVRQVCGKTRHWQQLDQCVRKHYPKIVSYTEQKDLLAIMGELNVTQQALYKVYRSCVPEDPLHIYGYENATTLTEILNFLLVAPVDVGGMPAILKFSEDCALLSQPHMASLRAWGDAFIQYRKISSQLLMHFRKEIEAEAESPGNVSSPLPLHLIIVLKTSEEDPQALRVKAWLCYGQDEPDPLSSPVEGQTYTVDAMPDLLDEMLAEVQRMSTISAEAKAKLNIEFFLPRSLISLPVDHWKIAEGTVVLGAQYRVVVRSLDRIESKKIYDHCAPFWEEKWKKVCTLSCGMNQEHIHWIKDAAAYDGERVYYAFGGPDKKAICLCLALIPPGSFDRDNKKEFFRMVLRAGIPIVFWPKSLPENPDLTEHFCKELNQLLGMYKPTELPDALFKQRWEAALHKAEDHHLGRCLTLLWDNPKRLPPDGKLLQIEQRR